MKNINREKSTVMVAPNNLLSKQCSESTLNHHSCLVFAYTIITIKLIKRKAFADTHINPNNALCILNKY